MCAQAIEQGELPACTKACPVQATIFGERNELLEIARISIAAKPDLYLNHIWGEKEVGGTCVFYISHIDLSFLSRGKKLGNEALPRLTAPAMEAVPYTFAGMGVFLAGLHWIIKRRMKLEKDKTEEGGNHE